MGKLRVLRPTGLPPMTWPEHVPADLRLRLLDVLSYRNSSPEDLWDEVRDWLEGHAVLAPPQLSGPVLGGQDDCPPRTGKVKPWLS